MRLLRLETAQKWVDADEEIAKVNYDTVTISRCSSMLNSCSMRFVLGMVGLMQARRIATVWISWLEWRKLQS